MEKPRLSFWQIWNMSFGFLGIQFGWGLQMANMSAIYEYLGARADQIPILWLAAPLTGLIVQPIIGHMSDRTWNRLGRRRPYFLTGALLASAALVLMPKSPTLWMVVRAPEPASARLILRQAGGGSIQLGEKCFVRGEFSKASLTDPAQHPARIMVRFLPKIGIEAFEHISGGMVPSPAEV